MGGGDVLVCGGAMTVGDFVLFEGQQWLLECILDDEAVISDKDGAERYVPLEQVEELEGE